ncbi:diacylglycerol binding protein [Schizosaccharomyces cryophilus OY26]|uniref:Diacylglycerol binding protein n=1 Tax=Schizosaccharomyces cryophilus (strain OY26 / ATCC MYA-4695 / CBS 11777 / NBRC 106824 / NRRL Y48691) TaxID=653667 RepID=S9X4W7_SCHCR|nr:diacylglycerol binding protein [Schizosaccharomyces cryophilus OY26]EPY52127.1 diacylglycerol binding protein [Schizosaccharomyces cryophilus OY26]
METIADHFFLVGLSKKTFSDVVTLPETEDDVSEHSNCLAANLAKNTSTKGASGIPQLLSINKDQNQPGSLFVSSSITGSPKRAASSWASSPKAPDPTSRKKDGFSASNSSLIRPSVSSITHKRPQNIPTPNISDLDKEPLQNRVSIGTTYTLSEVYQSYVAYPESVPLSPSLHPLEKSFPPSLLLRYPTTKDLDKESAKSSRCEFPNYVPMFVFPNDIAIKQSCTRPTSTYHSFALTSEDNSRIYGVCMVVWVKMSLEMQSELLKACDVWRNHYASPEDLEVVDSLLFKLDAEKKRLSQLLEMAQSTEQTHFSRAHLSDQMAICEENIHLYKEMLRPMKNILFGLTDVFTEGQHIWLPKSYGVLTRCPYLQSFCRDWLRIICSPLLVDDLDYIPPFDIDFLRNMSIEAYIKNICYEIPLPPRGLSQTRVEVGPLRLCVFRSPLNEIPGWCDVDLYPLFRALDSWNILTLFEAALLESKILFISKSISMLSYASFALIHLLYPLVWQGLFIPVLPRRLISCLEAPCSYIIGILSDAISLNNLQLDSVPLVVCDLDNNWVKTYGELVTLPASLRHKLYANLNTAAPLHSQYDIPFGVPRYAYEAYPNKTVPLSTTTSFPLRERFHIPFFLSRHPWVNRNSYVIPPILNGFLRFQENVSSISFPKQLDVSKSLPRLSSYGRSTSEHTRHFSSPPLTRSVSPMAIETNKSFSSATESSRRNSMTAAYTYSDGQHEEPFKRNKSFVNIPHLNNVAEKTSRHLLYKEGHKLRYVSIDLYTVGSLTICAVSGAPLEQTHLRCDNCGLHINVEFIRYVCMPCTPVCFNGQLVSTVFLKFFTKILGPYRQFFQKKEENHEHGQRRFESFNFKKFARHSSKVHGNWILSFCNTQAFSEFVSDRSQCNRNDPNIALFDQLLLCEKNNGKPRIFGKSTSFLHDRSFEIQKFEIAPTPDISYENK